MEDKRALVLNKFLKMSRKPRIIFLEIFLMAEQLERNGPYRHFEQRVGNAAPPAYLNKISLGHRFAQITADKNTNPLRRECVKTHSRQRRYASTHLDSYPLRFTNFLIPLICVHLCPKKIRDERRGRNEKVHLQHLRLCL